MTTVTPVGEAQQGVDALSSESLVTAASFDSADARSMVATQAAGSDVDTTIRQLARSGAWSMVAYAAIAGSTFVVSIMLGRALGPDTFGRYSFYLWFLRTLPVFAAIGFPEALAKLVPERVGAGATGRARGLVRLAVVAHLSVGVMAVVTAALMVSFGGFGTLLLTVVFGVAVAVLLNDCESALTALNRFRALGIQAVVFGLLQIAAVAWGIAQDLDWSGLVSLFIALATVNMVVLAITCRLAIRRMPRERLPRDDAKAFGRFAVLCASTVVIDGVLWGRPELLFLNHFANDHAIGLYSVALRVASLSAVLPLVAGRPLLPAFSRLRGAEEHDHLAEVFPRICGLLALIAAPLAIIGAVLAQPIIEVVYGSAYAGAATATGILLVGSIVGALTGPATAAMLTGPRPRLIAEIGVAAVVVNLTLDLLLIPPFGIAGAAIANVAVQVAWVAVGITYAHRRLGLHYPLGLLARGLAFAGLAAVAAAAVVHHVSGVPGILCAGLVGVSVYGVVASLSPAVRHTIGGIVRLRRPAALRGGR